jgi:hypothetical protein
MADGRESMSTIIGRHIPVTWEEWIDPPRAVRPETLCGKRTARKFTGTPGITDQAEIVVLPQGSRWGWCLECAYEFYLRMLPPIRNETNTPGEIIELHKRAAAEVYNSYATFSDRRYKDVHRI